MIIILSEIIITLISLYFVIQISTFWASITLVIISFSLIISLLANNITNLLNFILILVFIGGLIILLVSVSSLSYQEQLTITSFWSLPLIYASLYLPCHPAMLEQSNLTTVQWPTSVFIILIVSFILIISLILLTWYLSFFNSFIRTLWGLGHISITFA